MTDNQIFAYTVPNVTGIEQYVRFAQAFDTDGGGVTLAIRDGYGKINSIELSAAQRATLAAALLGLSATELAEAFCRWPLPASVCADHSATVHGVEHRTGTNLMSVAEAKQMFEDLIFKREAAADA